MPAELLVNILECIDDIVDAVSLCTSCKYLLHQGHNICSLRIARNIGFWAGARIACIRGDAKYYLHEAKLDPVPWKTQNDQGEPIDLVEICQGLENFRPANIPNTQDPRMNSHLFSRFFQPIPATGSRWALCNLSKRQYVVVRNANWATLGQLLVSQICWAPGLDFRRWRGAAERGNWVGDRFEITTLDRLSGGPEGWTDVSKELRQEMNTVRKGIF